MSIYRPFISLIFLIMTSEKKTVKKDTGTDILVQSCEERILKSKALPMTIGTRSEYAIGGEFLLVDKNGRVYSWGKPPNGTMGVKKLNRLGCEDLSEVKNPTPIKGLSSQQVLMVCQDVEESAFFAMTRHQIWAWGNQQNGTLGIGSDASACYTPVPTLTLDPTDTSAFVYIEAGCRCGAALTSRGAIYTWGMNDWGAGHDCVSTPYRRSHCISPAVPKRLYGKNIVYVHFSTTYSRDGIAVVTRDGAVLTPDPKDHSKWMELNRREKSTYERLGFSGLEASALADAFSESGSGSLEEA